MEGNGDCYEIAGNYALENFKDGLILCHGTVWHPVSGVHGHAWVEQGDVCIDLANGLDVKMDKQKYYAIGKITDVKRYTPKQAAMLMLKTKTYGPWE